MSDFVVDYWHWLVLGFGLLVLEMFLPTGFILLWLGAAAVIVGGIVWLVPSLDWQVEVAIWGLLSVAAILAWRHFKPMGYADELPTLNRRGHSYVGRVFTLQEPIVNGIGKLRVDDSQWRITGADAPSGAKVRVTRAEGVALHVETIH